MDKAFFKNNVWFKKCLHIKLPSEVCYKPTIVFGGHWLKSHVWRSSQVLTIQNPFNMYHFLKCSCDSCTQQMFKHKGFRIISCKKLVTTGFLSKWGVSADTWCTQAASNAVKRYCFSMPIGWEYFHRLGEILHSWTQKMHMSGIRLVEAFILYDVILHASKKLWSRGASSHTMWNGISKELF